MTPPRTCQNPKIRDLFRKKVRNSPPQPISCFLNFTKPCYLHQIESFPRIATPSLRNAPFCGLDVGSRASLFILPTVSNEAFFH